MNDALGSDGLGVGLSDELYLAICDLSEQGNLLMEQDKFQNALMRFNDAIEMLPEPKTNWDAYVWLKASTGDAYFFLEDYVSATQEFFDAMNGPDGVVNSFVLMRLGECLFEIGDLRSKEFLLRAYLLGGEELFCDEEPKYLGFLKTDVLGTKTH